MVFVRVFPWFFVPIFFICSLLATTHSHIHLISFWYVDTFHKCELKILCYCCSCIMYIQHNSNIIIQWYNVLSCNKATQLYICRTYRKGVQLHILLHIWCALLTSLPIIFVQLDKRTRRGNCPKSYNRIENNQNKWNGIKWKANWEKKRKEKTIKKCVHWLNIMMALLWFSSLSMRKIDYFSQRGTLNEKRTQ